MKKVLLMLSFFMTAIGSYAYDFTVDGIFYNITSKTDFTCEVTYYKLNQSSYSGDVVIPEQVTYNNMIYTVTGIGTNAFYNSTYLNSVILPESLKEIEMGSFYGCISLKEIKIPNNVKTIGSSCFYGCINLKNILLGNVQEIGSNALGNCASLTSIIIPKNVTVFTGGAFDGCTSLNNVIFEDGEEPLTCYSIGLEATALDSLYLGRNIYDKYSTSSSTSPFQNCEYLRSVYVSDYVTNLKQRLFYGCKKLENIYGMKNVETIGTTSYDDKGFFQDCISLKSFIVSNKVRTLGKRAFQGCTSLETLIIGNGIESLKNDQYLISGCNIKRLYIGTGLKSLDRNCLGVKNIQYIYVF